MPTATARIVTNFALPTSATAGITSTMAEPSVANNGTEILTTGNWYASLSADGGSSWQFINPFTFPPPLPGEAFCCDQTAIYDPSRDVTVWLLQYELSANTNTLRVAFQRGAGNGWFWFDLKPGLLNPAWQNEWFDFNHAALSNTSLYVGTNAFSAFGSPRPWTRSVVFRISLDALITDPPSLSMSYFPTTDIPMFCTQGATDTMYMAGHRSSTSLRVYTWLEATNSITQVDVPVSPSVFSHDNSGYFSPGPDGNNWLGRCDHRISGAWVARGIIGLMWTSDRNTNRPFPYVRVARINAASKALIDQPDIWSDVVAYAYANACPNNAGDVGVTLFRGGGAFNPGHVVGVFDDVNRRWSLAATRDGTNGPGDGTWGDYVTIRRDAPDQSRWIATGFTLQGGPTFNFVEPRLIQFVKDVS